MYQLVQKITGDPFVFHLCMEIIASHPIKDAYFTIGNHMVISRRIVGNKITFDDILSSSHGYDKYSFISKIEITMIP